MLISLSISVSCFLCAQMGSNVHTVQVLMSVCVRVCVCERARRHASPAAISLPLMLGVDGLQIASSITTVSTETFMQV